MFQEAENSSRAYDKIIMLLKKEDERDDIITGRWTAIL